MPKKKLWLHRNHQYMRSSSYTLFHRSEINYYSSKLPRSIDWKCRVNLVGLFTTVFHEKGAESRADDKLMGYAF